MRFTALMLPLAIALAARPSMSQAGSADGLQLPGRVVDVSAGEFFFRSPDSIPAGLTTFRLRQVGAVLANLEKVEADNLKPATASHDPTANFHMLWVVRLNAGRTAKEWYAANLKDEPTPWAINLGGPSLAYPPGSSNATFVLEPGNYILVCYVGSAREDRNRRHVLKGMFHPLTVSKSGVKDVLPTADITARITGTGQILLSKQPVRGRQLIAVVNETAKASEFIVQRIKPGRTADEVVTWKRTDGTSHPGIPIGGFSNVPPGSTLLTTIDFKSGSYVFWTVRQAGKAVGVTIGAP